MGKPDLFDFLIVLGALLLSAGCWLVAPALAFGVMGVLLMLFGIFGATVKGRGR